MVLMRSLTLVGGLVGGLALSQFPEYSQQYVQRLSGAVDELTRFVTEFDTDAASVGLTRDEALVQMRDGTLIARARAETMEGTFARHLRLSRDLSAIHDAGPFMRAYQAGRFADPEIVVAAWDDYRPALPITFEGAVFAGVGFLAGMLGLYVLWSVLAMPFRMIFSRRPTA